MATEGRPWAVCAVRARAGALCFAPDGEKITKFTPQTHNTRKHRAGFASCESSAHVPSRSPGGESAARWGQARARRRRQRQPRAASARRDAGGGQSRGGRRCGGGPTTAAVIAATVSELSRIITREERAERRGSARTRRHRRQRSPCGAMPAREGVQLVDGGAVCGGEHGMRTCDNWIISRVTTVAQRRGQWLLSCITRMSC